MRCWTMVEQLPRQGAPAAGAGESGMFCRTTATASRAAGLNVCENVHVRMQGYIAHILYVESACVRRSAGLDRSLP